MSRRKRKMKPDRSPAVEAMLTVEFPELKAAELTQAITLRRILCKAAKVLQKRLEKEAEVEAEAQRQRQAKGKAEEEEAQRMAKLEHLRLHPKSRKIG